MLREYILEALTFGQRIDAVLSDWVLCEAEGTMLL